MRNCMWVKMQQLEPYLTWNNWLVKNWEEVWQECILSLCLFNLYTKYVLWKAGLEELQAGIAIAGRNISNYQAPQSGMPPVGDEKGSRPQCRRGNIKDRGSVFIRIPCLKKCWWNECEIMADWIRWFHLFWPWVSRSRCREDYIKWA